MFIIIWLSPRAGKMNQIARCDWLPERARWSHLARSGLPAVSRKQNFTKSHIINPLLTKFVRSVVLFFASLWTETKSRSINTQKKRTWPISSHLDLHLVNNPYKQLCFCCIWHLDTIFLKCSYRFFDILLSLRPLRQVRDPDIVFPKLFSTTSSSVLCKMGHGAISLLIHS